MVVDQGIDPGDIAVTVLVRIVERMIPGNQVKMVPVLPEIIDNLGCSTFYTFNHGAP